MPASVGRTGRLFLFFFDQPLRQRDQLLTILSVAQGKKAFEQSQTDRRRFIGIQQSKLWRHLDSIH